jgi:hypothetical protein
MEGEAESSCLTITASLPPRVASSRGFLDAVAGGCAVWWSHSLTARSVLRILHGLYRSP